MSKPPIPTATVALVAVSILERKVKAGEMDLHAFSDFKIPGTEGMTYRRSTMLKAAKEAWDLCQCVEDTRPEI
jgi:hypothetical protein